MKKIIYINILILIIIFSCAQKTQNRKTKIVKNSENPIHKKDINTSEKVITEKVENRNCKQFTFEFNNENKKAFGIKHFENDLPVSPSSIILHDDWVYITDTYHNNIKRFNYKTNKIESSLTLSDQIIWLNDIIVFNSLVYVTSRIDSLYLFSEDLKLIRRQRLNKGSGFFYRLYPDSLIVYYPVDNHKFITLNKENAIIHEEYGYKDRKGILKGKKFKRVGNDSIETEFGMRKIENFEQYVGNLIDFDSTKFIYTNYDSTYLYLNICQYN